MGGIVLAVIALAALYWFVMRRWFGCWGAAASDLARPMACDAAVVDPTYSATLAITVGARPEHIWPWLVQMGYQRGGLYSYDWLDRLFGDLDRPAVEHIKHSSWAARATASRGPGSSACTRSTTGEHDSYRAISCAFQRRSDRGCSCV